MSGARRVERHAGARGLARALAPTVLALGVLALGGCTLAGYPGGLPAASPPVDSMLAREIRDPASIPDAVPTLEHLSATGNADYRARGHTYHVLSTSRGYDKVGIASWYGPKFQGKRTSSGEIFDMYEMTAAHRTLPLPTFVQVTNLANGRTAIVKVNDRGPFEKGRLIDLSYLAALKLGIVATGTARVRVRAVGPPAVP